MGLKRMNNAVGREFSTPMRELPSTTSRTESLVFPKHYAVMLIAMVACSFAGSHVAARVAFNDGLGLLMALACRSGFTALLLLLIALWRTDSLRIEKHLRGWLLLTGTLVAVQGVLIYVALNQIPVGLALLVVNMSPVFFCLITWLFGGPAPTRAVIAIMGFILSGLVIALNVPQVLAVQASMESNWMIGVACGLAAAVLYACALWITSNKLQWMPGSVRSLMTVLMVFIGALFVGVTGVIPDGLSAPGSGVGWFALAVVMCLYGVAFSTFFILMPKLDLARTGSAMNTEPVAGLSLGWLVLEQAIGNLQLVGAGIVVTGVLLLSLARSRV